jgi:exopolysaccharide production protein ExoQ
MPPTIATIVFALGVIGFFALDRDRNARTSKGLWIPVVWLLINGSRPVSLWLDSHPSMKMQNASQYLDGNPVERFVYSSLLAVGLVILAGRRAQVGRLLRRNSVILLFFSYCAVSTLWSDYTDVSFKRWIKGVGDLVMVLIVLTDSHPFAAAKRLVARVGFVLVPASILLIKYYPALGRIYNIWTWEPMFVGVTEHKNTLGMVCMILGLGFEWRFLLAYLDREDPQRSKRMAVYSVLIAMVVWLFVQANSVTAQSCFLLGTACLLASGTRIVARKRWRAYLLVAAVVAIPFATLFLGIGGSALEGMGRDATLTGRTEIWRDVLSMSGNPIVGTGFESFWLGARADRMWRMFYFHPTQAHNGYIEVYLELGWIGIALLAAIIVTGCRNAVATLRWDPVAGRIRLAYIAAGLAYNMTEAGFRMISLTWFFFLISAFVVPKVAVQEASLPVLAETSRKSDEWQLQEDSVPEFVRTRFEAI